MDLHVVMRCCGSTTCWEEEAPSSTWRGARMSALWLLRPLTHTHTRVMTLSYPVPHTSCHATPQVINPLLSGVKSKVERQALTGSLCRVTKPDTLLRRQVTTDRDLCTLHIPPQPRKHPTSPINPRTEALPEQLSRIPHPGYLWSRFNVNAHVPPCFLNYVYVLGERMHGVCVVSGEGCVCVVRGVCVCVCVELTSYPLSLSLSLAPS